MAHRRSPDRQGDPSRVRFRFSPRRSRQKTANAQPLLRRADASGGRTYLRAHGRRSQVVVARAIESRRHHRGSVFSVVIATPDVVGERMAGPGIRAFHFAEELSKHFPTTLMA